MAGQAGRASRSLVSVVVPVYNVAGYLTECLDSIRGQGVRELEIIAVDDGSTDESPAILAEISRAEPRLHVVTQANRGLGAARNTGVAHAQGEFLWFVDSDDRMAPGAIERLLGAITSTGSDLATGNVLRLVGQDTSPARFLAPTFARTRMRTHIHRFPPLIADRVAWNKLYRRAFWDRHDFRFPEGVHYEDLRVTLPAHYLASAVDVIREPVYLWRLRDDESNISITQQRSDPQSMLDRVHAVEYVSNFLAGRGLAKDKRRYDESAVTHDLRYFLERFDQADAGYREDFLTAVKPYLDGVDRRAFEALPAVRRLQWESAHEGDSAGLAELVRFEREELESARATRVGRRWYADFPGSEDPALSLPAKAVRVRRELRLVSTIDDLVVDVDAVRIRGRATIDFVGPVGSRLRMIAVPDGGALPLVLRTTLTGDGSYVAELPLVTLRRVSRGRRCSWRLMLHSNDGGLRRVAVWHERGLASRWAARVTGDDSGGHHREALVELVGRGRLGVTVGSRPPTATSARVDARGVLDLIGDVGDVMTAELHLIASGPDGDDVTMPVHLDRVPGGATFTSRLPLEPLLRHGSGSWSLALQKPGAVRGLILDATPIEALVAGAPVTVASGSAGYLVVTVT